MSPFFDRTSCNPFIYQKGYIEVIVEPLYAAWLEFLPAPIKQDCLVKGLDENKKLLEQKIEETKNLVNLSMSTHELNLIDWITKLEIKNMVIKIIFTILLIEFIIINLSLIIRNKRTSEMASTNTTKADSNKKIAESKSLWNYALSPGWT